MKRTVAFTAVFAVLQGVAAAHADDAGALARQIDQHIQARLDSEGIAAAPSASDAEFLRRATLDLHGAVPSAERAASFLASTDPQKREALIDELLDSPRFGQHFGNLWRGRLISPLVNEQRMQSERFTEWLAEQFNRNTPWDRLTYELLTATGKIEENPAVTYLIEGRNPLGVTDLTDLTSRYFLGVRLNCAQCHDHPFVSWKQHDYWGMAAFFAQIQTPNRPKQVYRAGVQDNPQMTMAVLRDADILEGFSLRPPTFLGGEPLAEDDRQPHRVALARWITSPENPYFARAAVNRLWWHFFGRGLVNPVDDMHEGNTPSHPELLQLLSERFAASGFDIKQLCRAILLSQTYQRTSRPGQQPDREAELFARMSVKVLTAEQLYDSLVAILGPPAKTRGINTRLGVRYEFTQFFDTQSDPTQYERGIPHLLRLMNSPQFAGSNLTSLVNDVAAAGRPADEVAAQLYLAILSRYPTSQELELLREQAGQSGTSAYRALAWALLMSSEFALNH